MDPDAQRQAFTLSSLAGGFFWGFHHLATTLLAGQPVHLVDIVRALLNVAMAIVAGMLVAYFLGPAIAGLIPIPALREAHALGFGIGAGAFEVAPFAYRLLPRVLARFLKGRV